MGTRSLTYFHQNSKPFFCFYRQMDGYPEGHGVDLGKILAPIKLINGISQNARAGEYANGPGCLAAQVVAAFKNESGIGGIYIQSPELNQDSWQEFEYHIHCNEKSGRLSSARSNDDAFETFIEVRNPDNVIFTGTFEQFYKWAQKPKRDAAGDYIPVIRHKEKSIKLYKELRDALHHEVVFVRFNKADGSERLMQCTTDPKRIPDEFLTATSDKPVKVDRQLFKVFDLDKNAWRSFREERVINWLVV